MKGGLQENYQNGLNQKLWSKKEFLLLDKGLAKQKIKEKQKKTKQNNFNKYMKQLLVIVK